MRAIQGSCSTWDFSSGCSYKGVEPYAIQYHTPCLSDLSHAHLLSLHQHLGYVMHDVFKKALLLYAGMRRCRSANCCLTIK